MIVYVLLAGLTSIYLIQSAVMDVKEKKIYSFPCMVLTFLWSGYLVYLGERDIQFLISFWMIHIFLFTLFNRFQIWGAGDSDILLLFANVFLFASGNVSGFAVAFYECVGMMVALMISLLVGFIECKAKREMFQMKGKAAVVPGFSVVMCLLMIGAGIWRYV